MTAAERIAEALKAGKKERGFVGPIIKGQTRGRQHIELPASDLIELAGSVAEPDQKTKDVLLGAARAIGNAPGNAAAELLERGDWAGVAQFIADHQDTHPRWREHTVTILADDAFHLLDSAATNPETPRGRKKAAEE